jgi:DNA topoisomerase-1
MWVIDRLALRVGNDKGKDEADTVGCCSLRCEHVSLLEDYQLEFDFKGKDSMTYHNTVTVIPEVYRNFKIFMSGKDKSEQIFDKLSTQQLNTYLNSLMDRLTAKVFRTYNASITMQEELEKFNEKKDASVEDKILFFQECSVKVAILCNHQRTVSKTHATQMEKFTKQITDVQDEIKELHEHIKRLEQGKKPKKRGKKENGEDKPEFSTNMETCEKRVTTLKKKIRSLEIRQKVKDTTKEVSTSTSKVNYIDPRITIAWCKKRGIDTRKIFAKQMRDKFSWAFAEIDHNPGFIF